MLKTLSLLSVLASFALSSPAPAPAPLPDPEPATDSVTNTPVIGPALDLLNNPPPKLLRTTKPSPQCKFVNGGELMCCRGAVAGDLQPVVWLAAAYGYYLNPNDVNGIDCDSNLNACPGVKMCCQVTDLTPLVALWCADYP